jgi:hypothetical protein
MKKIVSILSLCVLVFSSSFAQPMSAPFHLFVTKIEPNGNVSLQWDKPLGVTVEQYYVYRAIMPDSAHVVRIDSTKDNAITVLCPPSLTTNIAFAFVVVAKTSTGALLKSTIAFAFLPGIPIEGSFRLTARLDDASSKVLLTWTAPPINTILRYYVYRSVSPDTGKFALLDTTSNFFYTDMPPSAIGVTNLYVYQIKGMAPLGPPLYSSKAAVSVTGKAPKDTVTFTSIPPTSAMAGAPFTYQTKAVSTNPAATIRYALDRTMANPGMYGDQMKIDAVTGIMTWTPPAKGWMSIRIVATSDKGAVAVQEFQVVITGANGVLKGWVKDTADNPLSPVVIEVYKRDALNYFSYSTVTDKYGNYSINNLDTGSYILAATPLLPNLVGQWYNGKKNAAEATVVHIEDSSKSIATAYFKLRYRDSGAQMLTIKGSVTDTLGLAIAVKTAQVFFVRAEFALNSCKLNKDSTTNDDFRRFFDFDHSVDFRLTGNSQHVFKADVDSTGGYRLTLPQGSYVAFARAAGYATEFYLGHDELLSADVLNLTMDSSGINFTLASLPPIVLGEISGSVLDTANDTGVRSRIIVFRDRWNHTEPYRIARNSVTDTDSLGHFTLNELLPGWYIVMAVPVGNYAPAFYNTGVQLALFPSAGWQKATRIHVVGNAFTGINIYTHPTTRASGGLTGIGGHITSGLNTATTSVSGAIVYAVNASSEIVGYGISNASGNYLINGLAPGSYSVVLDKPGFTPSGSVTATPTYSANGAAVIGSVSFVINEATGVVLQQQSIVPSAFTLDQNFPNPFNPSTTIGYTLPASGFVTLKIYNILGQEVMTLVNTEQTAGTFRATFNAGSLASGVYIYRLQVGSSAEMKKMLLLK